ncbi:hypothetical protein AB6D34_12590 [Pectobacterium brasiliense]|uniref:hypothetical protein n=1 Tax=Pectobacterium TaxID=122277 RepID=UPI000FB9E98A|nr:MULTISPECIES: hypothetical protein [Pectobacterium]UKY57474.1 hypothetical protein MBA20_21150 [Pectobacterium brasiliense]GKW29604.1 hypothetical protein PEC331060_27820 [Pectobacterium carotovorum subsp. carotovorum]
MHWGMYSRRIDYIWNKCFEHIPGKIVCNKSFDAFDKINKEKYTETHKTSAEVIKELYVKNSRQVHELGFDSNLMKYNLFIDLGNYVKYCTLGEYLALMFELPDLRSLDKVDYKGYVGFNIKVSGQPYSGFVFRKEGDELYLAGLISGDKVFEAVTLRDKRSLSSLFMSYASHVVSNNNTK